MANAQVSGVQHGAIDRAKMVKPCPSKCGVLSVRVSEANDLTELLDEAASRRIRYRQRDREFTMQPRPSSEGSGVCHSGG